MNLRKKLVEYDLSKEDEENKNGRIIIRSISQSEEGIFDKEIEVNEFLEK